MVPHASLVIVSSSRVTALLYRIEWAVSGLVVSSLECYSFGTAEFWN